MQQHTGENNFNLVRSRVQLSTCANLNSCQLALPLPCYSIYHSYLGLLELLTYHFEFVACQSTQYSRCVRLSELQIAIVATVVAYITI